MSLAVLSALARIIIPIVTLVALLSRIKVPCPKCSGPYSVMRCRQCRGLGEVSLLRWIWIKLSELFLYSR